MLNFANSKMMKRNSWISVFIGCVTFWYTGKLILLEVSKHQSEPYMDEIFHIRQAQKYCVGRYTEVWSKCALPKKRNPRNPLTYYEIHLYIAKTN